MLYFLLRICCLKPSCDRAISATCVVFAYPAFTFIWRTICREALCTAWAPLSYNYVHVCLYVCLKILVRPLLRCCLVRSSQRWVSAKRERRLLACYELYLRVPTCANCIRLNGTEQLSALKQPYNYSSGAPEICMYVCM